MAFRIFSRLRFANKSTANIARNASGYSNATTFKGLKTGFAVGATGLALFLTARKTEIGQYIPVVTAQKPANDDFARGGMKSKTPLVPKPMAANTGAPCRNRKQQDEGKPVQANILSPLKEYSLFLWITLKPSASPCATIKAAANLQCLSEELNDCKCPEDNVIAGIGFGPNIWSQVMGKTLKNYYYPMRKGKHGDMPSTGGDILVHAKCDSRGKLFELCQNFLRSLPPDSIEEFEDVYSFNYQDGRDLSGFLVNVINPCDKNAKKEVAVECETGGSYALAQKWVHDFCAIEEAGCKQLEGYAGRTMECGENIPTKSVCSHVARMNGGTEYQDPPPVEIVRQAQPFGHLCSEAGIIYMAFANDPNNFEFLLDRMVGASCDGGHDDIMKITCNTKGSYWYFPGLCELRQLSGQQ